MKKLSLYQAYKQAIKAVEENNEINDAEWKDWENASQILDTYEIDCEHKDVLCEILDHLIYINISNSYNSKIILDALSLVENKVIFS